MRVSGLFGTIALIVVSLIAAPSLAKDAQPGLFIKPGEAYVFRLQEGQPVDVRVSNGNEELGDGELFVRVSHEMGTMMELRNGTSEQLNYQAYLASDATKKGRRTSVCTLFPGAMARELWPETLPGIRITNFGPANGKFGCF